LPVIQSLCQKMAQGWGEACASKSVGAARVIQARRLLTRASSKQKRHPEEERDEWGTLLGSAVAWAAAAFCVDFCLESFASLLPFRCVVGRVVPLHW
jgi:hypothetical protein